MSEPRYGWVMVALGAFMTCVAVGAVALAFPPFPRAARAVSPAAA
jgi:hypothetical protein